MPTVRKVDQQFAMAQMIQELLRELAEKTNQDLPCPNATTQSPIPTRFSTFFTTTSTVPTSTTTFSRVASTTRQTTQPPITTTTPAWWDWTWTPPTWGPIGVETTSRNHIPTIPIEIAMNGLPERPDPVWPPLVQSVRLPVVLKPLQGESFFYRNGQYTRRPLWTRAPDPGMNFAQPTPAPWVNNNQPPPPPPQPIFAASAFAARNAPPNSFFGPHMMYASNVHHKVAQHTLQTFETEQPLLPADRMWTNVPNVIGRMQNTNSFNVKDRQDILTKLKICAAVSVLIGVGSLVASIVVICRQQEIT